MSLGILHLEPRKSFYFDFHSLSSSTRRRNRAGRRRRACSSGQRPSDGLGHGCTVLEQSEERRDVAGGGTSGEEGLYSVSWRMSGGDREGRSGRARENGREEERGSKREEGERSVFPLLLEQGGWGGTHVRTWRCFLPIQTVKGSTETANFPIFYLRIWLSCDHSARGKVIDLCEVNNIDLRIKS